MTLHFRRGKFIVAVVAGVLAIAAVIFTAKLLMTHLTKTTASTARKMGGPIPVRVGKVELGEIEEVIGGEGVAKESRSLAIQAEISGLIREMRVNLGDVVKRGDLIAAIDDTLQKTSLQDAQVQINSAQTQLRLAQVKLQRLQGLLQEGLITIDELEKAQSDKVDAEKSLASARSKKTQAQHDLDAARINAPASGIVTSVSLTSGVVTKPYSDILTLGVIDPVHFEVGFTEDKIRSVQVDRPAEVKFYAYPGRKFHGRVALIKPVIDEKTRLMTIVVRLDNPDLALKPGMRGLAVLSNKATGLKVPAISFMSQRDGTAEVFTVDSDHIAHLRMVKTGLQGNGYVEVREGLTEGEDVVIVGHAALRDNDKVRIGDEYAPK